MAPGLKHRFSAVLRREHHSIKAGTMRLVPDPSRRALAVPQPSPLSGAPEGQPVAGACDGGVTGVRAAEPESSGVWQHPARSGTRTLLPLDWNFPGRLES
ncbi:unnamed protein product [Arctogadus glacialis]